LAQSRIRLDIESRASFAGGQVFGQAGPYERINGKVYFEVDPAEPALTGVVDLQRAPTNSDGFVDFSADFDILKPVQPERGNRRLLYDVSNRGNRIALSSFNGSISDVDPGNGFLMERGYSVVWSGWQGDLMPDRGLLAAELPEAMENGRPVKGKVRQEFIVEEPGVLSLPVSGDASIRCYPVLNESRATLTLREHEADARTPVARGVWQLAEAIPDGQGGVKLTTSATSLYVDRGFRPGWIYELIYETEGSRVAGLGLIGIRNLVSFLRYEISITNPLAGGIEKAYGFGSSLSARALRQFVYAGYNADEQGRRVFDAIFPHKSGAGRAHLNQRFAQIGRYPRQHEEHSWPSERYPFAYGETGEAFTEGRDSILKRPETDPLVLHTHTASEYWQRHASVGQIDTRTGKDTQEPKTVRMYFLAGVPHGARPAGAVRYGDAAFNAMNDSPFLRASLAILDGWVSEGITPPQSVLPRLADGSLVKPDAVLERFPRPEGVAVPHAPSRLQLWDYGPAFGKGIVSKLPPVQVGDCEYALFVPAVDEDGNEVAGLRSPDIAAPLGTYTGWYFRREGASGDLLSLAGSFIPFARTKEERLAAKDPRPSIEERYRDHADYVAKIEQAANDLMARGFLVEADARAYVESARRRDPFDPSVKLGPLV
jgi:hypothetical protein